MRPAPIAERGAMACFARSLQAPVRESPPEPARQPALLTPCRPRPPGGEIPLPPAVEAAVDAAIEAMPRLGPLRAGASQAMSTGIYFVTAAVAGARSLIGSAINLFRAPPWQRYSPSHPRALPEGFPPPERRAPPSDLPAALAPLAFSETHDIHYDGQFAIPGRSDAVVRFDNVMAREDWPSFIKQHLTLGESPPCEPLRVFFPGIQSPLDKAQRQLAYYHRVLGLPMAQIANGTTVDMGPLELNLPGRRTPIVVDGTVREVAQAVINRLDLSPGLMVEALARVLGGKRKSRDTFELRLSGNTLVELNLGELRELARALRQLDVPTEPILENMSRLILAHVKCEDPPPLEIMAYSEATITLGRALQKLEARYVAEAIQDLPSGQRSAAARAARDRYRERVKRITILTIGTGWRSLPSYYRVLHLYGWGRHSDQLTQLAGPLSVRAPQLGLLPPSNHGRLAYESPFPGVNAHFFQVTGAHALREYMEQNGSSTLGELWQAHKQRRLRRPDLKQVTRRIFSNGGHELVAEPNARVGPTPEF